jgi:hypothetical protein
VVYYMLWLIGVRPHHAGALSVLRHFPRRWGSRGFCAKSHVAGFGLEIHPYPNPDTIWGGGQAHLNGPEHRDVRHASNPVMETQPVTYQRERCSIEEREHQLGLVRRVVSWFEGHL